LAKNNIVEAVTSYNSKIILSEQERKQNWKIEAIISIIIIYVSDFIWGYFSIKPYNFWHKILRQRYFFRLQVLLSA